MQTKFLATVCILLFILLVGTAFALPLDKLRNSDHPALRVTTLIKIIQDNQPAPVTPAPVISAPAETTLPSTNGQTTDGSAVIDTQSQSSSGESTTVSTSSNSLSTENQNTTVSSSGLTVITGNDSSYDPQPQTSSTSLAKIKKSNSSNWSGYVVVTNGYPPQVGSVSYVTGSWVVPAVSCSPGENSMAFEWVGIDGYASNMAEQVGTQSNCVNGVPTYAAWFQMFPKPLYRLNLKIHPGDTVTATVQYLGNDKFKLSLKSSSRKRPFSISLKAPGASRSSAEWIAEAPMSNGAFQPLSNFGAVQFYNSYATLNGIYGTISNPNWRYDPMTLIPNGVTKASPGPLSSDGSSFAINWKAH